MGFNVQGKTALVTGANRGIGKVILESLLAHGAKKVYAAVRELKSAEELVKKHGDKVEAIQIDLNKPDTIIAAAKKASDCELVINNAGVLKVAAPLDDNAIDSLKAEMEVNVYGLLRMAKAFAPVLKQNGGGALVQLNSLASLRSFADFSTYCASKAASYSLTQSLRDKLTEQGTAVLSVHPGPIDTDMANDAGIGDNADAPEKVAEGIVSSLAAGEFLLFPDKTAQPIGEAYASFAKEVIEGGNSEA